MDLEIDTSQLQRILEIEDENDAATTPHGDAPVKKKRVRTTTTSLACETCRLKHKKCDGVQPVCTRCGKANEVCVYVTKRRKRGPARQSAADTVATPVLAGNTLLAENHLVHSSCFSTYVQLYEDHVAALVFQGTVGVPARDYSTFLSIQDPRRLLFMNGILATGARITGHWKHAHDYHMRARTLMGDLYDDSSALVAATHALFAYHYGSLGEIDKASYANSLALRILEHLMRTRPEEKAKDGIHYATLYLHSLMIEIDVTPTITRQNQFLLHVMRLNEQLDLDSDVRQLFRVFCNLTYYCNEALTAPLEEVPRYLESFKTIIVGLPVLFKLKPTVYHRLCMMTDSALATINLRSGNTIEALRASDQLMNYAQLLGTNYYDIFMVSGLFCAGQVYVRLGNAEKYSQVIHLLNMMAETFPLARLTCSRLDLIKELVDLYYEQPEALVLIPIQSGWSWELVDSSKPTVEVGLPPTPHNAPADIYPDQRQFVEFHPSFPGNMLYVNVLSESPTSLTCASRPSQVAGMAPAIDHADLNIERSWYYQPSPTSPSSGSSPSPASLSMSPSAASPVPDTLHQYALPAVMSLTTSDAGSLAVQHPPLDYSVPLGLSGIQDSDFSFDLPH